MNTENITLYFKQGSSDKIYKASLEKKDEQYVVNFAYGRRGATLKTGTKTQSPVDYEKAKKIYDKIVNAKKGKGYELSMDDVNYVHSDEQKKTGIHCQLLNPLEEEELQGLFENDAWWAQEKKDGKRMLIQKTTEVIAINRRGLSVGAPEAILQAATKQERSFVIDGEAIGETLFVFDILSLDGENLKEKSYLERLELLEGFSFDDAIQIIPTAKTQKEKEELHTRMKAENTEGIVLKEHAAKYTPGRPNSGGSQGKFKFYDTASVIVEKVNDKRSVAMMIYDGDATVNIGNVTISVNKEIPDAGSIIEVRYLYAYKGGSLYQPTFLFKRDDLELSDCKIEQLKYKAEM
ncbi:MAG: RNA ligase family protein [Saprospiraceae bacterium]